MLEWTAPLWLGLAIALPGLLWLHRRRERAPDREVAALFLWPEAEREAAPAPSRRRADPRWRRRALACGLLILAAAGPLVAVRSGPRVDVHVDDRPSLRARESDGPRLLRAVRALRAAVEEVDASEVRLLALGRDRPPLVLDPARGDAWAGAVEAWLATPSSAARPALRAFLPADRAHWLLTDGAHAEALEWARQSGVSRVVGFGEAQENAAVTLLAVRAQPEGGLASLVRVANAGREVARRTLSVATGDSPPRRVEVAIDPDSEADVAFDWPDGAADEAMRASLAPGDALPEDDTLTLDRALPRPAPVGLDPRCGRFVATALSVHPGVETRGALDAGAGIRLWCGVTPPPADGVPTVWWTQVGVESGATAPSPPAASPSGAGARVVRLDEDPTDPGRAATPAFAARLIRLLDTAAGRPLLDRRGVRVLAGGADAARIAPGPLPVPTSQTTRAPRSTAFRDASTALLWLALATVVVDSVQTARGR